MKTRLLYFLLFCTTVIWSACKKHDYAAGTLSPITSLEDVRGLYKGTDFILDRNSLMGAYQISGIVISNPDSGNVPAGIVVLQSTRRSKIRGIILSLDNTSDYKPGDSLLIEIEGKTLTKVNGALQIKGLTATSIKKISEGNRMNIQSTSSYSINLKPGDFESTLVKITAGTINPMPAIGDTFAGDKSVVNGADSVILHTEPAASFADAEVPATATFTGILMMGQTSAGVPVVQVWPRTGADITDRVAPVDPNGPQLGKFPVIITGFVSDAKGGDGNYEYFQFLATRDIDFEKTPMAVVTCTNAGSAAPYAGTAPAGGWATGGGRTYKFNLTSGSVTKGEFFYVGGSNKRINGPNSTLISDAKWIRSIAYVTNDGDGFGAKSGGLLPNSGNAGGIAIFEGINVAEESVPVDAVFFGGTGKTTIYDETNNNGYRIPENDHYNPVDPATSTAQPFFYQGTNLYVIPHQNPADLGKFTKLGGVFNATTKTWVTPRAHVFFQMAMDTPLSAIENGEVTILTN
ncbi:DUF5689 domain-containing protein [Pedobacter ginsengisoli]|uniref:DUF5689 domain-containing protein n=1 Tax=Pedobacter ginsengisoli TaxID=363852 RepID=UPI00254BD870|nr:DUF5689 domain-containing protein [Pedobacter ginsengisoli]